MTRIKRHVPLKSAAAKALDVLRQQLLTDGVPADSMDLTDIPDFARLVITIDEDLWLLVDHVEGDRFEVDRSVSTSYGRSQTTVARNIDADRVLRLFLVCLART